MSPIDHDYSLALRLSNVGTLESRRHVNDLLFLHSIVNSRILCLDLFNLFQFNVPSRTVRHPLLFHIDYYRTSFAFNSSIPRLTRSANSVLHSRDELNLPYLLFKNLVSSRL